MQPTTQQPIPFHKMHGLGNDFAVVYDSKNTISASELDINTLADRHLGIGFDQLLVIKPSTQADFACRIFNSDGSEAESCGNGMRCVARFLYEEKLIDRPTFTIETLGGILSVTVKDYDHVAVNMAQPVIKPEFIFEHAGLAYQASVISMGNPHAILQVNSIQDASIASLADFIAAHPAFPQGVNVGFMEIVNPDQIRLRTFERGAGETLSCGSNACAAVVAGITQGVLSHRVTVKLTRGNLIVEWSGPGHPVTLIGPASRVFHGMLSG